MILSSRPCPDASWEASSPRVHGLITDEFNEERELSGCCMMQATNTGKKLSKKLLKRGVREVTRETHGWRRADIFPVFILFEVRPGQPLPGCRVSKYVCVSEELECSSCFGDQAFLSPRHR